MTVTDLDPYIELMQETGRILDAGTNGTGDPDRHSWTPIDLVAAGNQPPEPPTISGLVYPGKRHLFSGKPEALKSWAAMILCAELIGKEESVLYVDFEMGQRDTYARLQDLNLTDDAIRAHFLYVEPEETFQDSVIRADVGLMLLERHVRLVIIDAFAGALRVHGLDPNKGADIETFNQIVVNPLRAHGAAVVILDHLPKDPNNVGMFAIGSERKVGVVEVHLGFEVIARLSRGGTGRAKILTHKDRPGYLPRPRAADLEIASDTTGRITWKLTAPDNPDTEHPFRPTHLMEKISRYLEMRRDEPTTLNQIEQDVTGKGEFIRKAIARLTSEGYVGETGGARNARLFASLKHYREADDTTSSHLVPTSSGRSGETTSSRSSPPVYGDGVVGDEDEVNRSATSSSSRDELLYLELDPDLEPADLDQRPPPE